MTKWVVWQVILSGLHLRGADRLRACRGRRGLCACVGDGRVRLSVVTISEDLVEQAEQCPRNVGSRWRRRGVCTPGGGVVRVSDLRIASVDGEVMLQEWRHVHSVIIPPAAMDLAEVREAGGGTGCGMRTSVTSSSAARPCGRQRARTRSRRSSRALPGHRQRGCGPGRQRGRAAVCRGAGVRRDRSVCAGR